MSLSLQSDIREREKPHERRRYGWGRSGALSLPLKRRTASSPSNRRPTTLSIRAQRSTYTWVHATAPFSLTSCSRRNDTGWHRVTPDDTGRHLAPRSVPGRTRRIRCPKGRGGSTPPSRTPSDLRIFVPEPSNRVAQEAVLLTLSPDYGASRTFMPRRNGAAHITSRGYEPSSLTEVREWRSERRRPTWSAGPEGACCWSPTRQSTSPPGAPLP
jgi:hypothetical protein